MSDKENIDTLAQEIAQKDWHASVIIGDVVQEADAKEMVESTVRDLAGLDVVSHLNLFILQIGVHLITLDGR